MGAPLELLAALLLVASGAGGLALSYIGYRHRDHPAATPFAVMTVAAGVWGFGEAATVYVRGPLATRVLFGVVDVASILSIAGFLWFVVVYIGREEWLTPRRKRAFVGLFALLVAFAVTLDFFATDVTVRAVNGLTLPVREKTPVFGVYVAVIYLFVLVGFGLLGRFLVAPRNVSRKQTAVILVAFAFALAGNVVFQAGLSPHPGLDTTPVFYLVETALIAVALFYYDFLDVEPLAPDIVLRKMDDPVVVLDRSERIVDYNPAADPLFDGEDSRGEPVADVLPGLLATAREGDAFVPNGTAVASDGGVVDVYDLNDAPISDQYGREQGSVVVLRDISVQKERERKLDALQSVSQAFLDATTSQEVADIATDAAEEVLGYPYSGVVLYDEDRDILCPVALTDSLERAYENWDGSGTGPEIEPGSSDIWEVFESGEPKLGDPLSPADEDNLPLELGGSLLFPLGEYGVLGISAGADHETFSAADRRFARTLASATETALDRVAKERELRESRELLKRRTDQIEFFNSVLRHDLLNGMMVVRANVDLLYDHVDEAGAERLATIDDWTADITTLAQKIRRVSRTVTGAEDIELEPVDLTAAVETKARKIHDGHDDVTVDLHLADTPRVVADELLPEVVENLMLNAVEHNDSGTPEITVETRRTGDVAQVRIADNGPGVPDEMKTRVFSERVTDENSGSVGFGLHFVGVMVDLYGGNAWLEDNDPRGTVAVIELSVAGAEGVHA